MKISKDALRKIIREEAGHLVEGCPVDLPCPYSAAEELKASGASPDELLQWVATLTQELVGPASPGASAEGVPSTPDDSSALEYAVEPLPMGIALESRNRGTAKKLSSRQLRRIVESVAGPEVLVGKPKPVVLPKKTKKRYRR